MTRKMEMIRIGSISFFFFLYKIRITILFLHDGNLEANREFVELRIYNIDDRICFFRIYEGIFYPYFKHLCGIVWLNVSSESC